MGTRSMLGLFATALTACGGGGGGGGVAPPVVTSSQLDVAPVTIPAGATTAELTVGLRAPHDQAPALLQVEVELPPGLTLPASDRLQAVAAVPTLDGDFANGRFVVLCGDASNQTAAPLTSGPLFRLRLETTLPRQTGTHTVHLRRLLAATSAGETSPVDSAPLAVDVVVQ